MKHYLNVCDVNGAEVEPVDVITFGSPCQDLSVAGKRADAIDEFVKAIEKHQTRQDSYLDPPYVEMGLDMTDVLEVAEQLKEHNK